MKSLRKQCGRKKNLSSVCVFIIVALLLCALSGCGGAADSSSAAPGSSGVPEKSTAPSLSPVHSGEETKEAETTAEATSGQEESSAEPATEAPDPVVILPDPLVTDPGFVTDSTSYTVIDESGTIWLSKEPLRHLKPASITKVLTALVTLEHAALGDTVTVSESAVNAVIPYSSGCTPSLKPGEQFTVRELLHALLLPSDNAAGNVLAEHIAGSIPAFAAMMNEKCRALGLYNSHFENPSGLDSENHYSCPYDMAVIFKNACELPALREIFGAQEFTMPATAYTDARHLTNPHRLLNGTIPVEGAFAGKNGWTPGAGGTLVTAAERNGKVFYAVNMNSDEHFHWTDGANLLERAFAAYSQRQPALIAQSHNFRITEETPEGVRMEWDTELPHTVINVTILNVAGTAYSGSTHYSVFFPLPAAGDYTVVFSTVSPDGKVDMAGNHFLFTGSPKPGNNIAVYQGATYFIDGSGWNPIYEVELGPGMEYYADAAGRLQYCAFAEDGLYYVGESGTLVTGWQKIGGQQYYFQADGKKAVGKIVIEGAEHEFDANGVMIR